MWPSDSRHVRASRTTWRLPSTACSMLSVSWSKVFLNQSACCWEMVTLRLFSRGWSPDEGRTGFLAKRVGAVDGHGAAAFAVVVGSVDVGIRVVRAASSIVHRAVDSRAGDVCSPVGQHDVDECA